MNICTIAGNIGKDPILRRTNSGDPVLGFSVAVDNGKDKQGNRRDATWFDVSIWGKRGEALERFLSKGMKVAISGRVSAREHNGKAYLEVSANEVTIQGGGPDNRPQDRSGGYQEPVGGMGAPAGSMEDSIPFAPEWRA